MFIVPLILVFFGGITVVNRKNNYGHILRILGFLFLLLSFSPGRDLFSSALVIVSITIAIILTLYTDHYSFSKYGNNILVVLVDMLLLTMVFTFISTNLIEFIAFWLTSELLGFFLIAYDYIYKNDLNSISAAVKYLLFSMIPTDIALFIILAITGFDKALTLPLTNLSLVIENFVVLTMILLGFFAKTAIIPFHFWLPDAHTVAPSPASALLSGIMVKMGIYGIYLLSLFKIDKIFFTTITLFFSIITLIYGAVQALIQHDIKKLLAYSTTSDTSLITILIALYTLSNDTLFLEAAVFYTISHALYKTSMFMDSGFIELVAHSRNIRELGYIAKLSPVETLAIIIAITAILGMPPSAGFLAKLLMFSTISHNLYSSWIYTLVLIISSIKIALSIAYNTVYLKAHISNKPCKITQLEKTSYYLQFYVFLTAFSSFLIILPLHILDYANYTQISILRKFSHLTLITMIITLSLIYILYKLIKYGSGWLNNDHRSRK